MKWEALQGGFGEAVRAARLKLGISQEELAFRVGLHRTYVGAIERGERNVSLRNLVKIAKGLRLTASELLALSERAASGVKRDDAQR